MGRDRARERERETRERNGKRQTVRKTDWSQRQTHTKRRETVSREKKTYINRERPPPPPPPPPPLHPPTHPVRTISAANALVFKAHRLLCHSTAGLRVIKKKKNARTISAANARAISVSPANPPAFALRGRSASVQSSVLAAAS